MHRLSVYKRLRLRLLILLLLVMLIMDSVDLVVIRMDVVNVMIRMNVVMIQVGIVGSWDETGLAWARRLAGREGLMLMWEGMVPLEHSGAWKTVRTSTASASAQISALRVTHQQTLLAQTTRCIGLIYAYVARSLLVLWGEYPIAPRATGHAEASWTH